MLETLKKIKQQDTEKEKGVTIVSKESNEVNNTPQNIHQKYLDESIFTQTDISRLKRQDERFLQKFSKKKVKSHVVIQTKDNKFKFLKHEKI